MMAQATVEVDVDKTGVTIMSVNSNVRKIGGALVDTVSLALQGAIGEIETYFGTVDLMTVAAGDVIYAEIDVDWHRFGTDNGRSSPAATPDCGEMPPVVATPPCKDEPAQKKPSKPKSRKKSK